MNRWDEESWHTIPLDTEGLLLYWTEENSLCKESKEGTFKVVSQISYLVQDTTIFIISSVVLEENKIRQSIEKSICRA